MFEHEIVINEFLLKGFERILRDIPAAELLRRGAGHGHPPAWILGHLAICAELGQQLLGGTVAHPEWLPLFGPGSNDAIAASHEFSRDGLGRAVVDGYRVLRETASAATMELAATPHGIALFRDSPITTTGHCVSLLLTNHFGFHMAQLSSVRRELGCAPLF